VTMNVEDHWRLATVRESRGRQQSRTIHVDQIDVRARNQAADHADLPAKIERETNGIRRGLAPCAIRSTRDFFHVNTTRLKRIHEWALAGDHGVWLPADLAHSIHRVEKCVLSAA